MIQGLTMQKEAHLSTNTLVAERDVRVKLV